MQNLFQDNKAQAGSVFKLLIGAVIGLAIIGIIYSIIIVMGNQKAYLSEEVFSNKIKMAMKNPIGDEYLINDYSFSGDQVLSKKALSEQTGLATKCISLKKDIGAQDIIIANPSNDDADYITFPNSVIVDLTVSCTVQDVDCPISCILKVYDRGQTKVLPK